MSTGHVKVMLLCLGIFAFAAVWSNDQRPDTAERTVVAYDFDWPCRIDQSISSNENNAVVVEFPPTESNSARVSEEWLRFPSELSPIEPSLAESGQRDPEWVALDKIEFVKIDSVEFPLPRGIAPGEYRVIDRFGKVSTQSVSLELAISTGFEPGSDSSDSYTARTIDSRWHYIRIEQDELAQREAEQLRVDARRAWKAVFQVIGQRSKRPIQALRQPLESWLSPDEVTESRATVLR